MREAAVIGVADERTGEAVVAYVVADGDHDARSAQAVAAHCAERLARFKRPTAIQVVDELPYTVTGKVQKGRLRAAERRRTARAARRTRPRRDRPGHPRHPARLPPVRRRPARSSPRVCADLGET